MYDFIHRVLWRLLFKHAWSTRVTQQKWEVEIYPSETLNEAFSRAQQPTVVREIEEEVFGDYNRDKAAPRYS